MIFQTITSTQYHSVQAFTILEYYNWITFRLNLALKVHNCHSVQMYTLTMVED